MVMCGRFTITVSFEELLARYLVESDIAPFHSPRYNVAPGQNVPALIHDGTVIRIGQLKWGLVPSWAKDEKMGYKMINARAETIMEKPAFQKLIVRKRAIIPADGFYEWKTIDDKHKQPMRMMLKNKEIFSMAALFDIWVSPNGSKLSTFTIITTTPNRLVEPIHNRMPVILKREDERRWLDRNNEDAADLLSLLRPYPEEDMLAYPVSPKVGNVKHESAACIEEIAAD
jgi:putative SOS response-associated peptidase YedK